VDLFLPDIAESMVTLLRRAGVDPVYHQGQTCCGQPAYNSGYRMEAKAAARHFIELFGDDDVVVSPSGSCAGTVKFHYPELFQDDPVWFRRATELAARVFELSQYLVDVLKVDDFGAAFAGKVAFHESCHNLRRLGISAQPRKLLAAVKGAEVVPMNQEDFCCGFGGTFANNYADISESMVQDKVENFLSSGADVLLLSEPGCLLNINGYLSRKHPQKKARHLASFLVENMKEARS
jgi:L-lactate dehydrogenase complex protein LldE